MNNTSLLNKAIYYWDWYLIHGEVDNLVAAHNFMKDYKDSGGEDYDETFQAIKAHIANKISPLPKAGKSPDVVKEEESEPLIFGYTHNQIANIQGSGPLK